MRVTVLNRGYFGGEIREPGETFDFPDSDWADEARRPSWVEPADGDDADDEGDDADKPDKPARGKRGRKPKAQAPAGEPEPDGNGITDALGGPAPDWLPPGSND